MFRIEIRRIKTVNESKSIWLAYVSLRWVIIASVATFRVFLTTYDKVYMPRPGRGRPVFRRDPIYVEKLLADLVLILSPAAQCQQDKRQSGLAPRCLCRGNSCSDNCLYARSWHTSRISPRWVRPTCLFNRICDNPTVSRRPWSRPRIFTVSCQWSIMSPRLPRSAFTTFDDCDRYVNAQARKLQSG